MKQTPFVSLALFILWFHSVMPTVALAGDSTINSPAKSAQVTVNVLGQVNQPGRFGLPEGATVLDALSAAGGPGKYPNLSKARILRKGAEKAEVIAVDLKAIMKGSMPNVALCDGDSLIVDEVLKNF